MKKIIKNFILLIFCLNTFFISNTYSSEIFVVLKINNNIITNIDIDNEYRYLIALNKELKKLDKKRTMLIAKESIVKEKIKETEIKKYFDISVTNKFMRRIMINFIKKLGMKTELEFRNYLSEYNLDYENVKKKISIEAAWNDIVYKKFIKSVEIDKKKIEEKINNLLLNKEKRISYSLSEILFNLEKEDNSNNQYKDIEKSILEIGFKNTANIYSLSDSGKLGGKIGWISENQISKMIKDKLANLEIGEYTKPIAIPGGMLILKLNDKKVEEKKLDFDEEFKKQISYEKNKQLERFSKIYFNKIKKNSIVSE